jgi:glycosyltransferase
MVHNSLKVSIITVVLNNVQHIENCINSVLNQTYGNIEYIVIDGGSTDGTIDVIRKYETQISMWVSEPDRGIYDAMNKGIMKSSGDIIGILNSDDVYTDEKVIEKVVAFLLENYTDSCYGDLAYVDRNDINKIIRDWKSNIYDKENFRRGWMPPHPAFFVKRKIYQQYGMFNMDFPLAADYELMLRFLYVKDIATAYIPECLVKMRTGGRSHPGLLNTCKNMVENYHAWKFNGLSTNPLTFLMKPLFKTIQYMKTKI